MALLRWHGRGRSLPSPWMSPAVHFSCRHAPATTPHFLLEDIFDMTAAEEKAIGSPGELMNAEERIGSTLTREIETKAQQI